MIKNVPLPSLDRLRELFSYDEVTGDLIRIKAVRGAEPIGSKVGTPDNDGHLICRVDYKIYYVHRIVWKMHYGKEPPVRIDHRNRKPDENQIINLRPVTVQQNKQNQGLQKNNRSGVAGVTWSTRPPKWKAGIKVNKISIHLGYFDLLADAATARRAAEIKYFGEFAPMPEISPPSQA